VGTLAKLQYRRQLAIDIKAIGPNQTPTQLLDILKRRTQLRVRIAAFRKLQGTYAASVALLGGAVAVIYRQKEMAVAKVTNIKNPALSHPWLVCPFARPAGPPAHFSGSETLYLPSIWSSAIRAIFANSLGFIPQDQIGPKWFWSSGISDALPLFRAPPAPQRRPPSLHSPCRPTRALVCFVIASFQKLTGPRAARTRLCLRPLEFYLHSFSILLRSTQYFYSSIHF
jgi:hypothetical protein